jgi:ADP-dependent NAD(P)H-hydrate dehydratase
MMLDVTPELLRQMPLPDPGEGDKRARGNVLIIGGSREVPGAALLAGVSALRAGGGRLQIATCASNASALAVAMPEALVTGLPETPSGGIDSCAIESLKPRLARADCVLLGSGLNDGEQLSELARSILEIARPQLMLVFDAGAIKDLHAAKDLLHARGGQSILTPHAGEMAGLMGMKRDDVEADPAQIAHQAALAFNAVVTMKGACTYISPPSGDTAACRAGNVGLATSGSGDVLAGIISGLAARGAKPFTACCWGVFLHATAGERLAERIGPLGYLARELPGEIPHIMGELSRSPSRSGD